MNWNHFILFLTGTYLGYYAINIITDLYLKRKPPGEEADDVLFFSEESQPEIILYDDEPEPSVAAGPAPQPYLPVPEPTQAYPVPAIESTGAVSLKELIRAAQQGLLQYTKAIPY